METKKPLHVEVFTVPLHEPSNRILNTTTTTTTTNITPTGIDSVANKERKEKKDVHIVFNDKNITTSALSLPTQPPLPLSVPQVPSSSEVSRRSMSDTEVSQADSTWIDVDQHDGVAIKTSSSLSSAGERGSEDGVYIATGTTHTAPARSQDSADTWRLVDSDKTDSHTTIAANTTTHPAGAKPTVINTKTPPPPTSVTPPPPSSSAAASAVPAQDDTDTASSKKMRIFTLENNVANGIPSKILSYRFEQALLLNIMKANTGMCMEYIVYVYIYMYCVDVYICILYICILYIYN